MLFILTRLIWMGFIIFTCGTVVADITRLPLPYVLAAVGVVTTIYTIMGGIRAVIVTDVMQFAILMLGGIMAIVYVTWRFGGFGWWPQWNSPSVADLHWEHGAAVPAQRLRAEQRVHGGLAASSLWWICTAASDQMMIQRYLCTRDATAARRSFLHCLIGDVAIQIVLWMIGFALLGYFLRFANEAPDPTKSIVAQADLLFPHFIATVLPAGLRGLIVAALFAAAMSSLSSGISSVSTVLVVDFGEWFAQGTGGDAGALARRAKAIGLGIGLFAIAFSYAIGYVPGNLFSVTFKVSNFFVVPLFVLYVMAFFVPFSTPAGAWAAIVVGFFAGVLFSYWKQIMAHFTGDQEFSVLLIMPFSLALSLGAGMLVSLVTKPREGFEGNAELIEQVPA